MSSAPLTQELLARAAGWQVMKEARAILAADRVSESSWSPPRLCGLVREGATTYRAGLVIHSAIAVDNLCPCRRSRTEGMICAHSVAVGLEVLARQQPSAAAPAGKLSTVSVPPSASPGAVAPCPPRPGKRLKRAASDEAAELREIHLIFPPNLSAALAKGKVMLVFEADHGGRRVPLNALPFDVPVRLTPEDGPWLDAVEALAGGDTPGMLLLSATELARVLPKLVGHPRLTSGRSQPVIVSNEPLRLPLQAHLEPSGEITLHLTGPPPAMLAAGESRWGFRDNRFQPLPLLAAGWDPARGAMRLARSQVPTFLSQDWPGMQVGETVTADFSVADFSIEAQPPRFRLTLVGALTRLEAGLRCAYGAIEVMPGSAAADSFCLPDPTRATRYFLRDLTAEQTALARLLRSGFTGPGRAGTYTLEGETAVLNFIAREFPRLQREWDVVLEERLEHVTRTRIERIEPKFTVTPSGEQWFDLAIGFAAAGGERFSPAEIQRLVLAGQSHLRLRNGRLAVLDTGAVEELQQVLLDCAPEQQAQGYRLANAQAGFLAETVRDGGGWPIRAPAGWLERAGHPRGVVDLKCPPLGALEAVLRPYQKQGVAWIRFLRRNGFGGILADEMGLGKTLQVLASLNHRIRPDTGPGGDESGATDNVGPSGQPGSPTPRPALVVCPTSLVFNWVAEATKFTPNLRVLALHGPDRHARFADIPRSDLVITSYALVRRDADQYRNLEFDTVVLDEAQHIKNRQTQNAQAVKSIRSTHRLVLTGTPLENTVLDLWSIFDFLMPGYLGAAKDFRERYELPITRDRDAAVQTRLARRIRPFLLRRLKRDVAQDLPAKLEQVAYCELTAEQASAYRQILEAGRREVLEAVGQQGLAKSRMVILTTLLRLRQVCCDLRLLNLPDVSPETASGKLDLFEELLAEVIDGGHRALVFSQFTTMLALLRERLAALQVEFCYLDGSTPDRGAVVQRFQARPEIPLFLISLKAGGTGLNLAGADTVIHFDPWWNPAVEAQATDRAHRLGQTRVVTSYKLIARGTVEEKILNLQARKRRVIEATLNDEAQFAEALDWDEIQELLTG